MATREPVIGIDLGTTFSAVATVEDGKPRIIPSRQAGRLTPSMVGFLRNGERVVGEAARVLLENLPENVAFATKRFLGRRWTPELAAAARQVVPYELVEGPNGEVRVRVAGRTLPLPQVSAIVLGELKLDAQAHFGREVTKAVITVPANFDDAQRQATKEAAAIAGLEVLRLVNEPTAAAVAYGLTRQFQGRALVFDLGGGTFDVSILEVQAGVFEVKATGGDANLGGEDFDNRIAEWLVAQLPGELREAVSKDALSMGRMKLASERAKRELTTQQEAVITLTELGDHASGERRFADLTTVLTRDFFEQLSDPLYRRCLHVCQQVMADARMDPKAVDSVLLVGGMTRVPLVRRLVTEFFGKEPVSGVNPDEVVALGAAVHASELAGKDGAALLIDVATHSLGVGMLGGMVRRLIPKNTAIPVVARDIFLPGRAGQREARIAIYQGEGETVDSSTKVGEVLLKDLQGIFRSDNPIEVTFEMSTEGTLTVRATDQTTGTAQALRIEARTELSPTEVDKLRKEQGDYAAHKAQEDAQSAPERFRKLMERGDKLYRLLQFTARETPSPQAAEAVGSLKELLSRGKTALEVSDAEQMTDVTRRLTRIINANK